MKHKYNLPFKRWNTIRNSALQYLQKYGWGAVVRRGAQQVHGTVAAAAKQDTTLVCARRMRKWVRNRILSSFN